MVLDFREHFPDFERLVASAGDDGAAVGRLAHEQNSTCVGVEGRNLFKRRVGTQIEVVLTGSETRDEVVGGFRKNDVANLVFMHNT